MWLQLALLVVGLALLYAGGEVLIRHASALARGLRVSPVVIGLTVIAFGTSAPELAAAISAAIKGSPDLAMGNVVGSNIANIGFILGLTVIVVPLVAERRFIRREVRFMIFTGLLLIGFVLTGLLSRWQALVLLLLFALFLWVLFGEGRVPKDLDNEIPKESVPLAALGAILGLVLLVFGADVTVRAAQELARAFGVSERVIGLTVVAFGTSIPELAGCLVAARRREVGLVLGNIVGSNIFNTLLILPVAMAIRPIPVTFAGFGADLLVMLAFSILLLLFLHGGRTLHRWEGAILVTLYLAYVGYLATHAAA